MYQHASLNIRLSLFQRINENDIWNIGHYSHFFIYGNHWFACLVPYFLVKLTTKLCDRQNLNEIVCIFYIASNLRQQKIRKKNKIF